ncbi:lysylphosphatidylglycerol synthase transmembrane domain-containing protein [Bosea lathyri]|uniref:Lysylphosphatidylglycerol synthase TM region n=1 Tax=Bosea lathyri TaxID=1036778 RepID=A0A1H6D5I3_9HYPH|nr:lysylphosphatidylglycerol synthase transmembrane domain-containing protein [Bosea lathyri]SEG80238.1 hypothetical protein SAMN04488115_11618 [Bosea lathyri]
MNIALKIVFGVALMALIIIKFDVVRSFGIIGELPYIYVISIISISFFGLFVQSAKTNILLPDVPLLQLFRINIISQIYAIVFFGQLGGDVAKAGYLGRSSVELHRIVAALVVDRVTGLIPLLALGLIGLLASPALFDPLVGRTLILAMIMLLLGSVALFLIGDSVMIRLLSWLPGRLSGPLIRTVGAARQMSGNLPVLAKSIAMGVLFQGIGIANSALLGSALGIDLPLTIWAVVICAVSLVLLVPVSIGGVGVRDVTLLGLLGGFGVMPERAIALSLSMLGVQLIMAAVGFMLTLRGANAERGPR